MNELADKIRERRKNKHWTQEDLAERSGVHVNTIIGVESGERSVVLTTIEAISKALGCKVVDLLDGRGRKSV